MLLDEQDLPDGLVPLDPFDPLEHFDAFPPLVEWDERLRHSAP